MIVGVNMTNIFHSSAHTLVCPVNTVGVMGAGLAKAFSIKFPGLLSDYRRACKLKLLTVEKPWVFHANKDRAVLCFATKKHWKDDSDIEWIRSGLHYLSEHYQELGIKSLAMPMVGCGLGGLKWQDVFPLVYEYLDPIEIFVETIEPLEAKGF